ncbi:MAG: hypothetical protein EOP88_07620 [Verrucomicrobiaceae bacterium]|nr:MAG: hypothetical protein EOP88_07620 [Verrucomicrobiaceae bacterium]
MRGRFKKLATGAILLLLVAGQAVAQAILEPPFGLKWGDSPEKLIVWASRHSLDVTISLPGDQPAMRVLKIEPRKGFLPETQAGAVEGRFLAGKLYELTVHYTDSTASADVMETRFEALRKQVALEHGTLLANQQRRTVEDQFVTRTQSFHREPVKGLFLLLAFTEVEDLLRKSKDARFSLIYRNDNFRNELLKQIKGG